MLLDTKSARPCHFLLAKRGGLRCSMLPCQFRPLACLSTDEKRHCTFLFNEGKSGNSPDRKRAMGWGHTICDESLCRFWAVSAVKKWELDCRACLHLDVGTTGGSSLRGRTRAEMHIERSHLVSILLTTPLSGRFTRPRAARCGWVPTEGGLRGTPTERFSPS